MIYTHTRTYVKIFYIRTNSRSESYTKCTLYTCETFVTFFIICIEVIYQTIKMKGPRDLEHTDTEPNKYLKHFKTNSNRSI